MPHAFQPPSVGLWCVNPDNLASRLARIASFANGMFSDVFVPRTATPAHIALIRSTVRPNGTKLRAQLWTIPGGLSPADYAAQVLGDINRLNPGVVELDIEESDGVMRGYVDQTIAALRKVRPKFLFRVNTAPFKGYVLPVSRFQTDPALYACGQTYYGDMSRASEAEVILDLIDWGIPRAKASCCYGAAAPTYYPANVGRTLALGTLYYQGGFVRQLAQGLVFQDDLMAQVGLL